jgi:hypothetical protein
MLPGSRSTTPALGCREEGFPQTYLGLPLSHCKLKLSTFAPYIAKIDRYLAGWLATLLNPMGRMVLINAVLDSQLVYLMSALPIPPGVLKQVDQSSAGWSWRLELEWCERKILLPGWWLVLERCVREIL